jgi:hypothetical protein
VLEGKLQGKEPECVFDNGGIKAILNKAETIHPALTELVAKSG